MKKAAPTLRTTHTGHRSANLVYDSALQPFCHRGTPDILRVCHGAPINKKSNNHEFLVRK